MTTTHRFLESAFDHCSDHCGWVAAVVGALAYGTFGVPIKETVSIDVHPLVLQSYKTLTMFFMGWVVVAMGEAINFTPWGILSGLLWVMGGTGGIYGIRNAGMAVAVGTWSSCMVVINFVVGILMFQEPVSSVPSTLAAFVLLGLGLVGMSMYSAPSASTSVPLSSPSNSSIDSNNPLMELSNTNNSTEQDGAPFGLEPRGTITPPPSGQIDQLVTVRSSPYRSRSSGDLDNNNLVAEADYDPLRDPGDGIWRRESKKDRPALDNINHWGLTKRQLGIMGAVLNGLLAGSSLVPIHYAKKQGFGGAAYMLSFATGALLSNCLIWAIWYAGKLILSWRSETNNSSLAAHMMQTYESMPCFHFKQLWAPGFSAGILLAIAMFGSIMAITYLGQGVGNSIIQSKILISGLWGIFWYKEISGGLTIAKWFASACLAVTGILWLSYERLSAKAAAELHL